jgi:hypothetical protein
MRPSRWTSARSTSETGMLERAERDLRVGSA